MFVKFFKHNVFLALLLGLGIFVIYLAIYPSPRNWYDHFLYLAGAFGQGQTDVASLPDWYHDAVVINNHKFLPFPPAPAIAIIPFIGLFPNITQQQISIILGSVNICLVFILIKKIRNAQVAAFVAIFAGLGTVLFWASVVGTSWYFAHTCAFLFLTASLISHLYKKDYLSGLLFAAALMCRLPVFMAGIFFLLELWPVKYRLIRFTIGALPAIPIYAAYNWIRYGTIFEIGYLNLYQMYTSQNYAYSFVNLIKPEWPALGYMDLRNIPLHLISFLVLPPMISEKFLIQPSPYGMGILFTSPLLLLALIPNFKNTFQRNLYFGAIAIALLEFMHYAQGWVQWGYRFAIDFLPFLLILLALKFRVNKIYISLLIVSIIVNFWGVSWGIKLGW